MSRGDWPGEYPLEIEPEATFLPLSNLEFKVFAVDGCDDWSPYKARGIGGEASLKKLKAGEGGGK